MTDYKNVTFVMSLPRSRTAWLAETFAIGAITQHDPLKDCASIDELKQKIDAINATGPLLIVDTASIFFFDKIRAAFPGASFLFILRSAKAVERSLIKAFSKEIGQSYESPNFRQAIDMAQHKIEEARKKLWGSSTRWKMVTFDQLDNLNVLTQMWCFFGCDGLPAAGWFQKMIGTNVQIPFEVQAQRTNRMKVMNLFNEVNLPPLQ